MGHETLGLIRNIFNDSLFLLDFGVLLPWDAAAEENTPGKDGNVANDHSQKAGCNSDHNANKNWNNNMHNDALEEACDSAVTVVMAMWAVGPVWMLSMWVRAAVMVVGLVWLWDNLNRWASLLGLRSTSLQLRESIGNNRSPFAENGCAFLSIVCRLGWYSNWFVDHGVAYHQFIAWCLEQLDVYGRHRRKVYIGNFEDLDVDRHKVELALIGNRVIDADCIAQLGC